MADNKSLEQKVGGFDIKKFVSNAEKYTIHKILPVVLTGLVLFTPIGCPWNKHKDRNTTTGSSGTPVRTLSKAGEDAVDLRFFYNQVYFNEGETQRFLRAVKNNNGTYSYITSHISKRYDKEVEASYNILCGETSVTLGQFTDFYEYVCDISSNGIISTTAQIPAPAPFDSVTMADGEITQISIDFLNKKERYTSNNGNITWAFSDDEMNGEKNNYKEWLRKDYLDEEISNPNVSYNLITGVRQ